MHLGNSFGGGSTLSNVSAEQVISTAENLPEDEDATSTVTVSQSWKVDFARPMDKDVIVLIALLKAACQATSTGCTVNFPLTSGTGRRGLQGASTEKAMVSRSLTSGSLTAEIPALNSTGVAVTNASFQGVDVVLLVTKPGGVAEADALISASLVVEQVRSTALSPQMTALERSQATDDSSSALSGHG